MAKNTQKKSKKTKTIDLLLPLDVIDFYRKVGKATGLKASKVIEVICTVEALVTLLQRDAQKQAQKQAKKGKRK